MKKYSVVIFGVFFILFLVNGTLWANSIIYSYTSVVSGGTIIDFEGPIKGTPINSQYAGVTFGQVQLTGKPVGSPQIDTYDDAPNVNQWLYAYGASSGVGVLTGSRDGGYTAPSVAGITIAFENPVSVFQAFFSDAVTLGGGHYSVLAFGADSSDPLETIYISRDEILSPAYLDAYVRGNDGLVNDGFPMPGRENLPGIYIGFVRGKADIVSIQIGPGSESGDAFAIDDVQYKTTAVPEPATMLLLGLGLMGLAGIRRKIE